MSEENNYGGFYQSLVGTTLSGLTSLFDKTSTRQTWNETYDAWSEKLAAHKSVMSQVNANELGLTELGRRKMLSQNRIRMNQDDAEASAKISAAVGGVQGGSVNSSIQQTKVNMGLAIGASNDEYHAQKMEYKDRAYQLSYNQLGIPQVRKKRMKNIWLDTAAKMAPIIGSKEFMNRVVNSWDAWKGPSEESTPAGEPFYLNSTATDTLKGGGE